MKIKNESKWDGYVVDQIISYNCSDVKEIIRESNGKVVLFGASNLARYALSALNNIGINVDIVCDSSIRKVGDLFCGYKIMHVDDISYAIFHIINKFCFNRKFC